VDDEDDVLHVLRELLSMCKIDTASSFEEAKILLESNDYHIVVLDIAGVNGFGLLAIAKSRGIPALMLTANALSEADLKKSAERGAHYYAPKDEILKICFFVGDVLDAIEKKKNPWKKVIDRLGDYYDSKFEGTNWREKAISYWTSKAG